MINKRNAYPIEEVDKATFQIRTKLATILSAVDTFRENRRLTKEQREEIKTIISIASLELSQETSGLVRLNALSALAK